MNQIKLNLTHIEVMKTLIVLKPIEIQIIIIFLKGKKAVLKILTRSHKDYIIKESVCKKNL